MELIIGDKMWSTWSMRPWLVLRHAGVAFTETLVRLRQETHDSTGDAAEAAGSPSRKVPALRDGDVTVWDSLAICEYLNGTLPEAGLWPAERAARALGRSAAAQMHSGFPSLRGECGMDLAAPPQTMALTPATQAEVRKLVRLWGDLRRRFGDRGPFLLGQWSIADAYYTPMATRIRTYAIDLALYGDDDGTCAAYSDLLLEQPEFLEWEWLAKAGN
jgi:glutathione S-transferase